METFLDFLTRSFSNEHAGVLQFIFMCLVAYVGGLISSLTPCVYPMIPITLGIIAANKQHTRSATIFLASLYVLGLSLVYAVLGVISALSGKLFGSLSANPQILLGLALFLTVVALFMMEVIHLDIVATMSRLKRFFTKKLLRTRSPQKPAAYKDKALAVEAFLLGLSSGLVAAPCTTPILTAILVFISNTRSVPMGFLLMLAFAFGLSTFLFLLACFAGFLKALPRSGPWMQTIKILGGVMILAYAQYLIYQAGIAAAMP